MPEEQRGLITALSDTAASYSQLVDARRLSWATRYRTLNRPLGAFFCGVSLWPRVTRISQLEQKPLLATHRP